MPSIEGIDRITYGVEDIAECKRFFLDWGLRLVGEDDARLDFESLNGCEVKVCKSDDPSLPAAVEQGPTLREVIWGVTTQSDLEALRPSLSGQPDFCERDGTLSCTDPNGTGAGFRVTRKRTIELLGSPANV